MNTILKKILFVILVSTLSVSCAKFDDMNENPYALYEVQSQSYVHPILYNSEYIIVQKCYDLIPQMMQHSVSTYYETSAMLPYNYVISEPDAAALWNLYIQKGNAESMLAAAKTEANPAMEAVALILRTFIMHVITDTYGNVPYSEAGLMAEQGNDFALTTKYEDQKEIYKDFFRSLEKANQLFIDADDAKAAGTIQSTNFDSKCDLMYMGDVNKWRRFGNSLYLRLLMRASLKVIEEDGGSIDLGEEVGSLNVVGKIAEIYDSFVTGSGNYPVITNVSDGAKVGFSTSNSAMYTPFYSTTSGVWRGVAACSTLVNEMIFKQDNKIVREDPRFYYYFAKPLGAPTQLLRGDMERYFQENVSSRGNSLVGRYPAGGDGQISDLKNADSYSLLNFSEVLFLFAEAGCRGWIAADQKAFKQLYLDASRASMQEWNPNNLATQSSKTTIEEYIAFLDQKFEFDNALEEIMKQKWIATFWVGIEGWADYRRTGYPILKTNGPAAENRGILPTRMRYPADEKYRNAVNYEEAVNGWLEGDNNMTTDVWWASTSESFDLRRKGRQ